MQINFTVFATGVILAGNKLRYKAYQADSPTAEVASITEDPPHTFPHAVTMNVPNPVVHIVKIFSTPDDSAGTLISEFIYDPTFTNVEIRIPLQLIVGGPGEFDPLADSNEVDIPFLTEWENLWYPERRANGGTMADFEYTVKPSGGLTLVGDDTFAENELLWIHFEPKITLSAPTFNYINVFNGIAVITEDKTLDSTYYRKFIEVAAIGTAITVTLPSLADVPDLTLLVFGTMLGNQKQVTFKTFNGTQFLKMFPGDTTETYLGSGEKLWLLKSADGWHVVDISEGVFRVGAQVDSDVILPNTAWMDGGTLSGIEYPRVRAYVLNLPAGQVKTATEKTTGGDAFASFWGYDPVTDTIYLPDMRGLIKRGIPGTRGNDSGRDNTTTAGSYQPGKGLDHKHWSFVEGQSFSTGGFPPDMGRVMSPSRAPVAQWAKTSGSGKESTWVAGAQSDSDVPHMGITSGMTVAGGTENIMTNAGVKMLVYL